MQIPGQSSLEFNKQYLRPKNIVLSPVCCLSMDPTVLRGSPSFAN